jgi:hypothetical protein
LNAPSVLNGNTVDFGGNSTFNSTISGTNGQVIDNGTVSVADINNIEGSGNQVYLEGTVNSAGSTWTLDGAVGSWYVGNNSGEAVITGGTIAASNGATLNIFGSAQLEGITLEARMQVSQGNAYFSNGLTLSNSTISAAIGSVWFTGGSQTLGAPAQCPCRGQPRICMWAVTSPSVPESRFKARATSLITEGAPPTRA